MRLQNGACRLYLPVKKLREEHMSADVLSISRTIATFPNGYRVVDEKITMPENYTFGKGISAVVQDIFGLTDLRSVDESGKMAIFEGKRADGGDFRVLAVFKGKYDLELLYPLNDTFYMTVKHCLIEKKAQKGATILNHTVSDDETPLPLSRWNQKLFDLDILVNKDM